MVYVLHKFRHFLLGKQFIFYVNHMALMYFVNKPQVFGKIIIWLLFIKYEFKIVYKPSRTHLVVDVLSILLNNSKPLGVPNQTMDASLFFVEPIWMQEANMLNHLKSTNCFKGATWRNGRRTFCCKYYYKNKLWMQVIYHNTSLGLVIKARACKDAGQEWSLRITFHALGNVRECEGINLHTPKWAPTLRIRVPMDSKMGSHDPFG